MHIVPSSTVKWNDMQNHDRGTDIEFIQLNGTKALGKTKDAFKNPAKI